MAQSRAPFIVGILAVIAFVLYSSIFVLTERQQAIVQRFGQIVAVKTEPGIYFKLPFGFMNADNVQIIDNRLLRYDLDRMRVQVSGGKFYDVDAFLMYRISDARRFRENASGSMLVVEQRLRTRLDAALRSVYGLRGFEAALSDERGDMMREVANMLRPDATELGITIADVRIRRTDLTAEVSQETYERMKSERITEATRLRARGREAAQRIKAVADRQVIETVAEARKESEILRGEGEAERGEIFAKVAEKDPGFFAFQRSMTAYREALQTPDTSLVLSPDSEFFKFFRDAGGKLPTPAQ